MKNYNPSSAQQFLWAKRYVLFYTQTKIPPRYFSVYGELHSYIVTIEAEGYVFPEQRVPDISVGRCWCHYLKSQLGENPNMFPQYPHYYPDQRGKQPAKLYPNRLRGVFHDWLIDNYFPNKLPEYIKKFSTPSEIAFVCQIISQLFYSQAA